MNREVPEVFLAGETCCPEGHTRRCLSGAESRAQLEEEEDEEENEKEREKGRAKPSMLYPPKVGRLRSTSQLRPLQRHS